jgi:hypothetical protein
MRQTFTQFQPSAGLTYRVALLLKTHKALATAYHWLQGKGYRCTSTDADNPHECCQNSKPSWTCNALALRYLNADENGKLPRGAVVEYSIGYIGMSRTVVAKAVEFMKETPECDLLYSNVDGNYLIEGASREPRWKGSPQAAAILAAAQQHADGEMLRSKMYEPMTDEEWHLLLTSDSKFGVDSDED